MSPWDIIADIFVIIDYSGGSGTNTSAVELLLTFCMREYETVVLNGRASSKETVLATTNNNTERISGGISGSFLDLNHMFLGSTSDGVPTTDVAELFAQAAFLAPEYSANLLAIMNNIATSLTNTYIFFILIQVSFSANEEQYPN